MRFLFLVSWMLPSLIYSQTFDLTGRVITADSQPVSGALVRLAKTALIDSTDTNGIFHFSRQLTRLKGPVYTTPFYVRIDHGSLIVANSSIIQSADLSLFTLGGKHLLSIPVCEKTTYSLTFKLRNANAVLVPAKTMLLVRLTLNKSTYCFKSLGLENICSVPFQIKGLSRTLSESSGTLSVTAPLDTMIIQKTGHVSRRIPITDFKNDFGNIVLGRQFSVIDSNLVDAEYSSKLGLVACVCSAPDRVILYKPETEEKTVISLNKLPTCISVSPDGEYAVVGHDAMISSIDLKKRGIKEECFVSCPVFDIVLSDNGYAYSFPSFDQWVKIYCTNLATRKETGCGLIYAGTKAKLHPSGKYIYGVGFEHCERYDITDDTISKTYDDSYSGDYYFSRDIWISEDGNSLYAKSGNTFTSNPLPSRDMLYAGRLNYSVLGLSHSSEKTLIAALPDDSTFYFYNPRYLNQLGIFSLKSLLASFNWTTPKGRFVFFNGEGTACTVVLTGKDHRFAAYTMNDDQYPAR